MREIQLTQNQVALVDDCDFEELNKWSWFAHKSGRTFYARRTLTIGNKRHTIRMHHIVIGKPPIGFEVDHKNGIGTDNQRENLRFVTDRQNSQNRKNVNVTSVYPGVYWHSSRNKWMAQIYINGKSKFLGRFIDEHEAFNAYRKAVNDREETVIDRDISC